MKVLEEPIGSNSIYCKSVCTCGQTYLSLEIWRRNPAAVCMRASLCPHNTQESLTERQSEPHPINWIPSRINHPRSISAERIRGGQEGGLTNFCSPQKEILSLKPQPPLHLHLTGQNVVTWPHPAARQAGKCSLLSGHITARIKSDLSKEEGENQYELDD